MYKHPWISATFGVCSNIFILFVIILSSWTRFLTAHTEEIGEKEDINSNHEGQENVESLISTNMVEDDKTDDEPQEDIQTPNENDILMNRNQVERRQRQRRYLLSFIIFSVKSSIQLVLLFSLLFVSYQAYVHDVYEPSKLMNIVTKEIASGGDIEMFQPIINFLSNLYFAVIAWDDIFVKLFVIKIIFAVMFILIMSATRFID